MYLTLSRHLPWSLYFCGPRREQVAQGMRHPTHMTGHLLKDHTDFGPNNDGEVYAADPSSLRTLLSAKP